MKRKKEKEEEKIHIKRMSSGRARGGFPREVFFLIYFFFFSCATRDESSLGRS